MSLLTLAADVEWPDDEVAEEARRAANPGVGTLGGVAEWLAGAQRTVAPRVPNRIRLIRFGTDDPAMPGCANGDPRAGVRAAGKTQGDVEQALQAGVAIADDEIERGADLCAVTVSGSERASAVLVSVLTDTEPVRVLPRGAAMAPSHWIAAAEAIRDERRAAYGLRGDPAALLAAVGAPDICAAVGFLLRAAARRTPMLVDGLAATVAALVAFEVQPRSVRWWRPADRAGHPAAAAALSRMSALPVLDLGTDLGDGTAALLAAEVVRAAAAIASDPSRT